MENIRPKFYSIADAVKLFNGGLSRQWFWEQVKDGKIDAIHTGRKIFIDARWIEEKEREINEQRERKT